MSLSTFLKAAIKAELQASGMQSPPVSDYLLRPESVYKGLMEVAQARYNEICEEYPELGPIFDLLANNDIETVNKNKELYKAWQETIHTARPELSTFETFVEHLESIGPIGPNPAIGPSPSGSYIIPRENRLRINGRLYRLGNIYLCGFHKIKLREYINWEYV